MTIILNLINLITLITITVMISLDVFLIALIFLSSMLLTMLLLSHSFTLSLHKSLRSHHLCHHVHSRHSPTSSKYRYHIIIKVWSKVCRHHILVFSMVPSIHMNTSSTIAPTPNISPLIIDEAVKTTSPGGQFPQPPNGSPPPSLLPSLPPSLTFSTLLFTAELSTRSRSSTSAASRPPPGTSGGAHLVAPCGDAEVEGSVLCQVASDDKSGSSHVCEACQPMREGEMTKLKMPHGTSSQYSNADVALPVPRGNGEEASPHRATCPLGRAETEVKRKRGSWRVGRWRRRLFRPITSRPYQMVLEAACQVAQWDRRKSGGEGSFLSHWQK